MRQARESDHDAIETKLDQHDVLLKEMALRLRKLEIEAGIYKPPLKGVRDDSS